MWIKGIFLLLFALVIDALQVFMAWMFLAVGAGFQLVTPAGGAAGGAAAGAYLCWNSSAGVVSGVVNSAVCAVGGAIAGAGISAFGVPIGEGLGFIVDICISLTMGTGLIMALIFCGMFYPKYVWGGSIVEFLPGFDIIPAWTAMVVLCILQKKKEEGSLVGKASTNFATMLMPTTTIGAAFRGVKNMQRAYTSLALSAGVVTQDEVKQERVETRQRLKGNLQNIDGIRPIPAPLATPSYAKTA